SLISNNFTGELPQSLAKLTTLVDFRISDNNFSGNIPNFIQNWTNLRRLEIQGSGLSGPIPRNIASSMANLSDLRISDLNGNESTFPLLSYTSNFKYIILRSCNIIGQLPEYLGKMSQLKILLVKTFLILRHSLEHSYGVFVRTNTKKKLKILLELYK
ncbi:probable LRR receptor-like serine/threonine-protein kinase At1g53420, partial [Olea europaea var. sylvestris]|uniref:probable LRR receptor-like serine/threonine-protein kinase At1g53420 n=1 Tax=Olea europaea var. sylvestris TaxID=158386 RepID=UPI000C1CCE15